MLTAGAERKLFGLAVQTRLASQARHKIVAPKETFAARIVVHAGFVKDAPGTEGEKSTFWRRENHARLPGKTLHKEAKETKVLGGDGIGHFGS
jgi:hypothetical protein